MSAHGGRRNKGHGGEHENHERWLLTYADMITLLVAFFIMLYAMSVTNQAKFVKLALSVRSGFGNGSTNTSILTAGAGNSHTPKINTPYHVTDNVSQGKTINNQSNTQGSGKGSMMAISSQIETLIAASKLGSHISVRSDERGIVVSVHADKYTFDSGSFDLKPALKPVLDQMADIIAKVPNIVRVEGHTDNLPIHNAQVSSNWDLSSMRASRVLTYMLENHKSFDPDRFSSNGYADTRPVASNDTEDGRAKNRRVDIVILNDEADQPMTAAAGSSGSSAAVTTPAPSTQSAPEASAVDITSSVVSPHGSKGKASTQTTTEDHFKVEPFMPKISLKSAEN